jgi:Dockerin type I domain
MDDGAWERLGAEVAGEPVRRRSRIFLFMLTPLAVCSVFLLVPVEFGRSEPSTEQFKEHRMKSMAIVAAAAWTAGVSAQNLVVNGGFEQSVYPGDCCAGCGTAIQVPGWVANNVDQLVINVDAGTIPPEGVRYLDLNQCSPGSIHQSIPTQVGRQYRVSFMMGSVYTGCHPGIHEAQFSFGSLSQSFQFEEGTGMSRFVFLVSATSASTQLEFRGLSVGCESAIIDDVSVAEVVCLGDADASGSVDGIDLAIVLQNWGVPSAKYPGADINADGEVNGTDLAIVLAGWGACP